MENNILFVSKNNNEVTPSLNKITEYLLKNGYDCKVLDVRNLVIHYHKQHFYLYFLY